MITRVQFVELIAGSYGWLGFWRNLQLIKHEGSNVDAQSPSSLRMRVLESSQCETGSCERETIQEDCINEDSVFACASSTAIPLTNRPYI